MSAGTCQVKPGYGDALSDQPVAEAVDQPSLWERTINELETSENWMNWISQPLNTPCLGCLASGSPADKVLRG
jgi:hypothetical protein